MDFNKIKEMGLEYAEKGKNAALDLAETARTQAKIVNAQGKLYKAQRQLGALVYSLAKGNEENQPLVDKYIELIASIEQELTALKESLGSGAEVPQADAEPAEEPVEEAPDVTMEQMMEAPEEQEQPDAPEEEHKVCPECGAPVLDKDALYCNKCGKQL